MSVTPIANHPGYQSPGFWRATNEHVKSYATMMEGGSPYLRMYTTPDPSGTFTWYFAHREAGKAALHTLPLVTNATGQEFVHVIVQKAPVLGGRPIVQLPAGMWGDKDLTESALDAVKREMKEETGYDVKAATMIGGRLFATSPGAMTEMKGFALANVSGEASDKYRDAGEKGSIIASFDVPVETFLHYDKFMAWMGQMNDKGYTIGIDILAARALLPPGASQRKLDIQA